MKKRAIYIVLGLLFLAAAGFFGIKVISASYAPAAEETAAFAPVETETPAPTVTVTSEPTPTPEPTPEPTPYISPIDFEGLQALNPDIYAWLEMENANISYPIVQNENDSFYLDHNSDKHYSANGSIFSETKYNVRDMSDPVTILYGHHMASGAMFGNLQRDYSNASFFEDNPFITVYTPDATLEYGVFAAVPFSGDHILYYNDFTDDKVFESFFDSVFNIRDLSARFRDEYAPKAGDKVLILSTCLASNNMCRFLVMATLLE